MQQFKFSCLFALAVMVMLVSQSCSQKIKSFEYASKFYKIQLTDTVPFVKYFSVDALGKNELMHNPVQWRKSMESGEYELSKVSDSEVKIYKKGTGGDAIWDFNFEEKSSA